MKWILTFLISGILFTSQSVAQTIRASTSAEDVYAMQVFDVTFTIENGRNANFTPPDFKDFRVSAGPFSSSNITIVNGNRKESQSVTYRLIADKPGKYKIGPGQITTSTLKRKSNTLTINVLKATKENVMQGNNIFLEMTLNDSTVYVGQQLLIDHDIFYGNIDVKGSALVGDFPRDRFLVNQVMNGGNIRKTQMMYQGKMQNKAKISRLALFPLRSGEMEIPDINFDVDIQNPNARRRRGFFSFNSYDSKVVRTPEFTLDILPLPADAPESYTGCVGNLTAKAQITSRSVAVGEELFLQLTLSGNGLADQIDAPAWKQDGFQIFDPKLTSEDKKVRNGEIIFTKVYQYLVIPDEVGRKTLRIPVSHFDPVEEKYVTTYASISNLNVTESANTLTDAKSKTIKTIAERDQKMWYSKPWIWGVVALLLAGLIFFFVYRKKKPAEVISVEEASRIIAQRKLSSAKDLLDRKETGKYWETLENALRIYLEEKLDVNTSQYSISAISDKWLSKNYDENKLNVWKDMVDKINRARYAGQDISNMENLYKEALDWIVDVELSYPS